MGGSPLSLNFHDRPHPARAAATFHLARETIICPAREHSSTSFSLCALLFGEPRALIFTLEDVLAPKRGAAESSRTALAWLGCRLSPRIYDRPDLLLPGWIFTVGHRYFPNPQPSPNACFYAQLGVYIFRLCGGSKRKEKGNAEWFTANGLPPQLPSPLVESVASRRLFCSLNCTRLPEEEEEKRFY